MKLHVLSDLHLNHLGLPPAEPIGDVLVLAGDMDNGRIAPILEFTERYRQAARPVLFVPGNHDYYGENIAEHLRKLSRVCRQAGVTLLHNRAVEIGDVRFVGSTLWTDFAYGGADPRRAMLIAREMTADYEWIRLGGRFVSPELTRKWHKRALRILERIIAQPFAGPTVIISHHGVHPNSVHPRLRFVPNNAAFVSDLTQLIARWSPTLMIHGHVHNRFDYRVGNTRVITNPRGYCRVQKDVDGVDWEIPEHADFDPNLLIEVGV